eukprot:5564490-Amphidinium_carterae.1
MSSGSCRTQPPASRWAHNLLKVDCLDSLIDQFLGGSRFRQAEFQALASFLLKLALKLPRDCHN